MLLLIAGCFKAQALSRPESIQVSGKVLSPKGTPLSGGTIILRPESGLFGATALVQSDGTFTLKDNSGVPGVVAGKYQVFVSFPNPQHAALKASVNPRYQESEDGDSDIFVEIVEPTDSLTIKLKK